LAVIFIPGLIYLAICSGTANWNGVRPFILSLYPVALFSPLLAAHAMYRLKSTKGKGFWQWKLIPISLEFILGVVCVIAPSVIALFLLALSELASSPPVYTAVAYSSGVSFPTASAIAFLVFLVLLIPLGIFLIVHSFRRWMRIY